MCPSQAGFDGYFSTMPGLVALPYVRRDDKMALASKFGVKTIPNLVLIDGEVF